jgi:small subunit ribosomal protein S1
MEQNEAPMGQEELSENNQTIEEPQAEQNEASSASMESLLEEEGVGLDFPKQGEIRTGVIASLGENEILVSIGTKSEGVIPSRELEHIPEDVRAEFSVGSEILVYVVNPEDQSGGVLLSYTRAMEEQDWKLAEELLQSGETYEGEVIGFNKGGLLVPMGQLRGFVPGSQISVLRRFDASGSTPEQRWGTLIGENLIMRVIEVDRERRRLILSERAALQETRETLKDRLLIELNEGEVRTGRVTSLADFGAFVNIDGADGLVHLSELSWERIEHPREVLKVGQEVEVKIIGVDQDRKRIGLSMRQLQPDPWMKKVEDIREGQLVEGTITHLTKFGAFASLGEDLEGLIHISEISEQRVAHPKEVLHEGDVVTLRVIKIEPERRRIGLSLRKVDSPAYTDLDWKTTLAEIVEGEAADTETPEDAGEVAEAIEVAEEAEVVAEVAEAVEGEAIVEAAEAAEALEEALEVAETAEVVEEIAEEVEAEAIVEAAEAAEALEEALEVAETAEVVEEIAEEVETEAIEEAVEAAEALEEALEVAETAEVVEEIAEEVETEAIEEALITAEALEDALEVAEAAEQVEEMAEEVEAEALADAAVAAQALEEAEDLSEAAAAAEALADALKVAEEAEALEEMAEEVQAEALADAAEAAEALEESIEVAEEAEAVEEIAEAVEAQALIDAAEAEEALEEAIEVAEEAEAVEEIAEAVEVDALIDAAEAEEALEEAFEVAEEAEVVEEIAEEVETEALIEAVEAEEALEEAFEVAEEAEVVEEIAEEVETEALIEAAEAEADAETSADEGTAGTASES